MADDKAGRDKQAHDEANRQHERDINAYLERGDELEPPIDAKELDGVVNDLEALSFPATGTEIVESVGAQEIDWSDGTETVEELLPDTDAETFDSPEEVRKRLQVPTVAGAMKDVVEATDRLAHTELSGSQRTAYEKTFLELRAIDADDDDEGIQVISDWIVERLRETEKLPGSRAVRREAAKFCRKNDYEVRNDQWLGI